MTRSTRSTVRILSAADPVRSGGPVAPHDDELRRRAGDAMAISQQIGPSGSAPRPAATMILTAAAVVTVLGLGAAGVALTNHGSGSTPPDAAPAGSAPGGDDAGAAAIPSDTEAFLDSCWQAAVDIGRQSGLPERAQWRAVLRADQGRVAVVAVRAADTALFCEITPTTVTVSDASAEPAYVPDTRTGTVLTTAAGTIAGVLDPSWASTTVTVTSPRHERYRGQVRHAEGLFVFLSTITTPDAKATIAGPNAVEVDLPTPAPPAIQQTWAGEAADRSSPAGRALGQCVTEAMQQRGVPDADTWRPGAAVEANGERLIMAVNAVGVGACIHQAQRTEFMPYAGSPSVAGDPAPVLLGIAPTLGGLPLLAGTVPAEVTRLTLTLPDNREIAADIANSTFAAVLPEEVDLESITIAWYVHDQLIDRKPLQG